MVISDDLPEILACCHRILIMKEGRITEEIAGGSLGAAELAERVSTREEGAAA